VFSEAENEDCGKSIGNAVVGKEKHGLGASKNAGFTAKPQEDAEID